MRCTADIVQKKKKKKIYFETTNRENYFEKSNANFGKK